MTSSIHLPILGRELRVAARKRSTFWLRTTAAIIFLLIGTGAIVLMRITRMPPSTVGDGLFETLTWLSFAAALSAGVFFTADSLSEEKREGTLGLLFLTDLRGYDIATGKLMAAWLRCFYALLAVFPVLAITMLVGGVTGAQCFKTMLALINTLFCSLAVGLFVSVLSRDSQKAMAAVFGLLALLTFGGSWADRIFLESNSRFPDPIFALSSPMCAFGEAGTWGRNHFWSALAISNGIGWLLLAATCVLVPRTWQERTTGAKTARGSWSYIARYGGRRRRSRLRRTLLERSPAAWLCCRERWQALAMWGIALITAGGSILGYAQKDHIAMEAWSTINWLVLTLIYLWIASQAVRFFVETRRSGVLELLLVSPLEPRAIVRANWQALLRGFALPLVIILASQGLVTYVTQYRMFAAWVSVPPAPPPAKTTNSNTSSRGTTSPSRNASARNGTNSQNSASAARHSGNVQASAGSAPASSAAGSGTASAPYTYSYRAGVSNVWNPRAAMQAALYAFVRVATTAANLIAIVWFGLWMGMTSRNSSLATLKTLGFVQIAPVLVIWFTTFLVMIGTMKLITAGGKSPRSGVAIGQWIEVFMFGCVFALSLAKDIVFSAWGRARLRSSFRQAAAQTLGVKTSISPLPPSLPPVPPSVPPLPSSPPVPPRIASPV